MTAPNLTRDRKRPAGRALCLAAVLSALAAGLGAAVASAQDQGQKTLRRQVEGLVAAYEKKSKAVVGLSAVDLRAGGALLATRGSSLLIPASNQKLLTSAFALARLGGDYRFVTSVYRRGEDIVIVGGYDPTLGDAVLAGQSDKSIYAELDAWAAAVSREIGRRVGGDMLLSSPAAQKGFRHPDWPEAEHGRSYAAPLGALNFHNNCLNVAFRVKGKTVEPLVSPESRLIRIVSKVKLGRRNLWSMRTNDDDSVVTLTGTVAGRKTWPLSVPMDSPPLLLGRVFADRLARAGVDFSGEIRSIGPLEVPPEQLVRLAAAETPIAEVMKRANKRSLNMVAECMFLRAGDGTWARSAELMGETLVKQYNLPAGGLTVGDGCGLSRKNRVSPEVLAAILSAIAAAGDANVLLQSLPVAGVDGTLKGRLTQEQYEGRVAAKTGYMLGVCCLSGYVLDETGTPAVAFSIMVNDIPAGKAWQAKRLQDAICRAVVDWLDGEQNED
jgi:D-alanyl-D-alanine carboxypeptidase/D-alanyl-D-alanine-endopeptidase (penicillin-binding protein 4)